MTSLQRERASAVCVQDGHLLCVQLRDPATQIARLFVPGGAIEAGETAAAAAERETFEETGFRVRCDEGRARIARYPFVWNGQEFQVITHFIWATLCDPSRAPEPVTDAPYNEGARWIPLADVPEAFSFLHVMSNEVLGLLSET